MWQFDESWTLLSGSPSGRTLTGSNVPKGDVALLEPPTFDESGDTLLLPHFIAVIDCVIKICSTFIAFVADDSTPAIKSDPITDVAAGKLLIFTSAII